MATTKAASTRAATTTAASTISATPPAATTREASTRVATTRAATTGQRYERDMKDAKDRHLGVTAEFDVDDMNTTLTEEERKRGWHYPLTKTQQKKEYGCVVAEQQRFLWRLQDGHLDIVEDYLGDPKKKKTIDVNLYDEQGWTPLHYASQLNHSDIVKALLDGDANPTLRDKVCGLTAYEMATMGVNEDYGPNDEVLDVLKSYGIKR
mmetsp:Transcript_43960/g.136826  ORF Transcript_43960/g.136826 Transcript_43960/m.136826 type:complete len:208 (-) Transcript_43960:315-938(-)